MIYDISPDIDETIAVWPGDTPFSREWLAKIETGANIDLSTIKTTVHIGAHADAPSHYLAGGVSIDKVDLSPYLGPCSVVTVKPTKGLIEPRDFEKKFVDGTTRILFRTLSFINPNHFTTDFAAFSPATMEFLGLQGVVLVGIDTPSVDPFDSKTLDAHKVMGRYGIRNLEGLILDRVPDGRYELIALPLKIKRADASPVRAILRAFS